MMMWAFLLGQCFESEVILTLDVFTSKLGDRGYNGAFLLPSLWINCFSSVPEHWNENLGCRDHGKISMD